MLDTQSEEIETPGPEVGSPETVRDMTPGTVGSYLSTMKGRAVAGLATVTAATSALVPRVAAADMIEVNFTPIIQIVEGFIGVIPSLVNLIISMVPAILVLALVGFILMFLDKILQLIGSLVNLGR